jgi:hypothetical protein
MTFALQTKAYLNIFFREWDFAGIIAGISVKSRPW